MYANRLREPEHPITRRSIINFIVVYGNIRCNAVVYGVKHVYLAGLPLEFLIRRVRQEICSVTGATAQHVSSVVLRV